MSSRTRSNVSTVLCTRFNIVGEGPRARSNCGNGTNVRFILPCGHLQFRDFAKGPVSRRMDRHAVRWMVASWTSRGGVYIPVCRKCGRPK